MLAGMARNRFTVRTLVPLLGIAVLVLGGLCAWVFVHDRTTRSVETPFARAERQVHEQRGADWEVRYIEAGTGNGRAVCGYAGPRNGREAKHPPVAFISRLGRILFADEPLPTEFRDLTRQFCPAFTRNPVPPVP